MNAEQPLKPALRALLCGLSLSLVGCLCVAAVILARSETSEPISRAREQRLEQQLRLLLPPEALGPGTVLTCRLIDHRLIGRRMKLFTSSRNGEITGYILTYATARGYSNPLVLIAGFDRNKNVYRADIQFSLETPGLGDKVDRAHGDFLDALSGKTLDGANWDVKKFGGDFDFITGSTVTSRAVVLATRDALTALREADLKGLKQCPKGGAHE